MRWAAFVMGILGMLAAGGAGGLLLMGQNTPENKLMFKLTAELIRDPSIPQAQRDNVRAGLGRFLALPYFLLAAVPLGLIGAILARGRRGGAAAILLLLAISGPIALAVGYEMALSDQGPRGAKASGNPDTTALHVLIAIPVLILALGALFAFRLRPEPAVADDEA